MTYIYKINRMDSSVGRQRDLYVLKGILATCGREAFISFTLDGALVRTYDDSQFDVERFSKLVDEFGLDITCEVLHS